MRLKGNNNRAHRWRPILGLITAGLIGCSGSIPPPEPTTVVFALPNGWNVTSATYVVWSPAQIPVLQGIEDLGNSRAAFSLSLLVPPGNGDVLQLTVTTDQGISCSGISPPFDVTSGQPTQVSLVLSCLVSQQAADTCPTVGVQLPTPAAAEVPAGRIAVAATGSDPDPGDVLSFSWAASVGTFGAPTSPSTYYLCTSVGAQTLVLTVDDNHLPRSCTETFLLPVECLPVAGNADAGACGDACAPAAF
jgi:hypothetical protein